jgi:hypothetical protein
MMSRSTTTSSIASTATSSHGHKRDNQVSTQNLVCRARPPLSSLLIPPLIALKNPYELMFF